MCVPEYDDACWCLMVENVIAMSRELCVLKNKELLVKERWSIQKANGAL